ncbi:hypothetical protein HF086_013987 [Spodoptera exigua]|uniref:Uncharacterized protein n=1 Tax=Spodoptera exigua TaxID=7107 RepID=A0A922MLM7_SPOEX|nr:hypothetical protein HF086_013987 [Spodoptera exigua]
MPYMIMYDIAASYPEQPPCWWLDQPGRFLPMPIARRTISAGFQPTSAADVWKVREVLTRGILLTHSLATSVDYLCVMQGLLDEG